MRFEELCNYGKLSYFVKELGGVAQVVYDGRDYQIRQQDFQPDGHIMINPLGKVAPATLDDLFTIKFYRGVREYPSDMIQLNNQYIPSNYYLASHPRRGFRIGDNVINAKGIQYIVSKVAGPLATGEVTFSRLDTNASHVVPVKTALENYRVQIRSLLANENNPAYFTVEAYVLKYLPYVAEKFLPITHASMKATLWADPAAFEIQTQAAIEYFDGMVRASIFRQRDEFAEAFTAEMRVLKEAAIAVALAEGWKSPTVAVVQGPEPQDTLTFPCLALTSVGSVITVTDKDHLQRLMLQNTFLALFVKHSVCKSTTTLSFE